jgi:hypothetical protein
MACDGNTGRREFIRTSVCASLALAVGAQRGALGAETKSTTHSSNPEMESPIDIGTRLELFVDVFLVEETRGVRFKLHRPERREVSFLCDAPWEDDVAMFYRVLEDSGVVRLYYRASIPDRSEGTVISAMAESTDGGLTFVRPDLGIVEYEGSKKNNILFKSGSPFPSPPPSFIDTNPGCKPDERYKGFGTRDLRLYAVCSADGLRWRSMHEGPLEMPGVFDTINTAFWDTESGCYRSFTRSWHDSENGFAPIETTSPTCVRAIQSSTSKDFIHWTEPIQIRYDDAEKMTQMYTNSVLPCPGAEHIYLGFPNRYVPTRTFDPNHTNFGLNDALFMTSRDCVHWKRSLEAWVRPGLDPLNWTDRNNYPTWGIVQTSPTEWSMYVSEHYRHPGTPARLRRLSIRPHGFASMHADYTGGEFTTKPLVFSGDKLQLNYSTSAAGSLQVEIQHADRTPFPGFGLEDMDPLFGDELDRLVKWKGGGDLSAFIGIPVRFRFRLKDADLFALQTVPSGSR